MQPFDEWPCTGTELPVVASVPHSGTYVPDWAAAHFEPEQLAALWNSDWFLAELYAFLPRLGIRTLVATHSRYVGDLNRPETLPFGDFWKAMVAEKTATGLSVYRVRPTSAELERMRDEHHRPYHQRLGALLDAARERFGKVYLLDLHSFFGLIEDDVCLGNAHGKSSSPELISAFELAFRGAELRVVQNRVFSGGHITRHYGALAGTEALQIELRYSVYHDCVAITEPRRPEPDEARLLRVSAQLERVFEDALGRLFNAGERAF
ncbi:MAG TPA: N-formylglutamate amidohydrolase [Polyangiaceae bacterium]|nr:N-formylglutamate amidohydrolase [Polyangiaceae bacterium]